MENLFVGARIARSLVAVVLAALVLAPTAATPTPVPVPLEQVVEPLEPDVAAALRVLRVSVTDVTTGRIICGGSAVPIRCERSGDGSSWEIVAITARHVVDPNGPMRAVGGRVSLDIFDAPALGGPVSAAQAEVQSIEFAGGPSAVDFGSSQDIALLRARSPVSVPVVSLAPSLGPVRAGQSVVVSGFPFCEELHVQRAIVSSLAVLPHVGEYWHVSSVAVGGMSGGAVLDSLGRMVAIITNADPRAAGIMYALPIAALRSELESAGMVPHSRR